MTDMVVIVPSRHRPQNIERLIRAWADTHAGATLAIGFDDDDEKTGEEIKPLTQLADNLRVDIHWNEDEHTNMATTLNRLAVHYADHYAQIGFLGDDHLPRTLHWDHMIELELRRPVSMAYGNDLFQGVNLPTAVFMTSDIIRTLGYMSPPVFRHMWIDNVWKEWGTATGRLSYLSNVIIEHIHPQAGKADIDQGYREVWPLMDLERGAYDEYHASGAFDADVAKLRTLR
jgi:hypothetical protein